MPFRHAPTSPVFLARLLLLIVAPLACARGVTPDDTYEGGDDVANGAGSGGGGSGSVLPAGNAGTTTQTGGTPSTAGTGSNAFGGTATSGGKPSGGAGGAGSGGAAGGSGGGGAGGTGAGGKAGAGGAAGAGGKGGAGGAGGASGSGGAGGGCSCGATLAWKDDTNISWKTGDCLTVDTAKYVYVGMKMQTYANHSCNPTKQETWCTDSGNDYKFTLCK